MAVYLIDHPPRIRQYRSPRRATPSGVCVVHTAESFPDEVGPDTGAENVAAFIARRTNYGSYHDLADSDSIVPTVRYSDEAFHDGTGSNPHSYGVSAATQAHRWNSLSDGWVDATVRNMARATARYARWIKTNHGVTIPARRISRAQSERRVPGFISHAERDPDRRTDPGATFPWDDFLGYYADEMNGDDDMPLSNDDLNKIADRVAAVQRQHDGNSTGYDYNGRPLTRDEAMFRGAQFAGGSLNLLKYTMTKELAEIRAAAGGHPVDEEALAQRLASLLLPEVGDQIRAELAEVDGVDEDIVAEKIVARVGAKLTAPDA